MITLQKACEIVKEEFPNLKICQIVDRESEWVIGVINEKTGKSPDFGGDTKINKFTGKKGIFFPPRDGYVLDGGKIVEIPEQYR